MSNIKFKRTKYDLVVVGGGPAGIMAAVTASKLGKKVALLEKDKLGGDCVWNGCIPSKAFLKAGKLAREIKRLDRFDIKADIKNIDSKNSMSHIRDVMQEAYEQYAAPLHREKNIDVIYGDFAFCSKNSLSSKNETVEGEKIIISVGAKTWLPPIDGLNDIDYMTNEKVFSLENLPKSIIVIGAGAIGIELASSFNRLGTEVVVALREDRILSNDDPELTEILFTKLQEEGVKFLKRSSPKRLLKDGKGVMLEYECNGNSGFVSADSLLLATGRTPDVDSLNLEACGVSLEKKRIKTDLKLQSENPDVYAAGDCVGPYGFTHSAEYQAYIAVQNAFGGNLEVDYTNFGWCTFTDPELAGVGLTESKARELYGEDVRVYRQDYKNIHRGFSDDKLRGLAKTVCDKNGKILGASIVGERAAEFVNEIIVAKSCGISFDRLADIVHIYPTFSDIIVKAARECRDSI